MAPNSPVQLSLTYSCKSSIRICLTPHGSAKERQDVLAQSGSHPTPNCLYPLNGTLVEAGSASKQLQLPISCATFHAHAMSWLKTAAARPLITHMLVHVQYQQRKGGRTSVISLSQNLVLVLKLDNDTNRTKGLFLDDSHLRRSTSEHGRSDKVSF